MNLFFIAMKEETNFRRSVQCMPTILFKIDPLMKKQSTKKPFLYDVPFSNDRWIPNSIGQTDSPPRSVEPGQ